MSSQETRHLLDGGHSESSAQAQATFPKCSPLPKVQLGILCLLRVLDPMNFSQIFPYINQFLTDLHVTNDPSQIGFYSGVVESAFAFSQLLSIYPWGFFSDRYGRRPVVLVGVSGLTISTLLFGLSSNLSSVMISRTLAGLFSGNVAVIPVILSEITDESNQTLAFPFFGLWWPVGAIIGPLIGGLFSNPATRYPKYFNYELFMLHPYFLPCLLISAFSALALIVSWFSLQETLNRDKPKINTVSQDYGSTTQGLTTLGASESYTVGQLLSMPIIRALCVSGSTLSFISTTFDVIFVLFCYSPVKAGGLGFSASEIGGALSASGAIAALLQVFFMPTILRRVNHAVMYHFCMKLWPYTFIALPFLNIIAVRGSIPGTDELSSLTVYILWIGIALVLCVARVAFLAYSINMLLVKRHVPNSSSLGSTTGLVQFSICFSRTFAPVLTSWAFVFLDDQHWLLGGYAWAFIFAAMGFTGSLLSKKVVLESSKASSA
ncbi:MFS general substrate transporter [Phlegmacium glaucopus]|nr:MFS general substrate transporter [Phlegmacium glaucopus]